MHARAKGAPTPSTPYVRRPKSTPRKILFENKYLELRKHSWIFEENEPTACNQTYGEDSTMDLSTSALYQVVMLRVKYGRKEQC